MKFIYFKAKEKIENKIPMILEIISEAINISKFENDNYTLTIHYSYSNIEIKELANIVVSELFEDITIYESLIFKTEVELKNSLKLIKSILNEFTINEYYLNNKILLTYIKDINENVKQLVLNKYYNDKEMYLTIKTYLEHNQNVSKASEYLYIHRNTLNQRLNKFKDETNFNVKKFIDGHLIYKLL